MKNRITEIEVELSPAEIGLMRLERLSHYGKRGQFGHTRFDFRVFHRVDPCGTSGCLFGEGVFIWPDFLEVHQHSVRLIGTGLNGYDAAAGFFSITFDEAMALFNPLGSGDDARKKFDLPELSYDASAVEVAENIDLFIARKRSAVPA